MKLNLKNLKKNCNLVKKIKKKTLIIIFKI